MRRVWSGLAMAIALAAITAGGVVIVQDGAPPEGTAHVWIDTDGGTCVDNASPVEYDSASACGSMDAANDVMDNGDTALMMGGSYGGQSITGGNSRSSVATITVADGETVTLSGSIAFNAAEYIAVVGGGSLHGEDARLVTTTGAGSGSPGGVAATENQYGLSISDSEFVSIQGADFGGWHITDSRSATVKWNDIGPCHSSDSSGTNAGSPGCQNGNVEYCEVAEIGCEGYNVGHRVEGNYIHDFGCDANFFNGSGSDECHWECMYVSYANDLEVRGNVFVNCANGGNIFHTFSNGGGSFTADFGYEDYTLENNVFTQSCSNSSSPCGGRLESATGLGHCNLFSGDDFTNVRIRFNTFLGGSGFDMDNACTMGSPGVTFTGNIRNGQSAACAAAWSVKPTFQYELYYNGGGTCTGTGNDNIGGTSLAGVVSDSNTAPDGHLTGAAWEADDLVPTAAGCASVDIDGTSRPVSTNCDAGADER